MNLFEILEKSATAFPEHLAVIHGERKITYGELLMSSVKIAEFLSSLDLDKGSRVAILFENSIEYLISFFSVYAAEHVAVPIDNSINPKKINYILADCQVSVLMVQTKYERFLDRILGENTSVRYLVSEKSLKKPPPGIQTETMSHILEQADSSLARPYYALSSQKSKPFIYSLKRDSVRALPELAAIFYTSGSTGNPKGVMLSHRNLISNTIATAIYLNLRPQDSVIVILPFYYIYGNSLLLTHILVGGNLVIDNRFLYPEVVLETMERERVTGFSGVPSNFMILLNSSTFASRKLEHLRYFTQAGGAMAPEVIRRLMKAFPHKEIFIMYGLTEASPRVSYVPPDRLKDKVGSIGIPVPGVQIKVLNEDGHEMAPGEEGEIAVFGDNVMLGYWNDPEENRSVLKDGWLLTGDLGRMDGEGYFYITGRKKDIIKAGGNRVSAKEIEECILELEKVAEVAVFGVTDNILGEAIKAVVVIKVGQPANEKDIQNFCKSRLADHKVPKYIQFADSLPKYK
ncbi:MAG TPA: class I adenylate-forming enzyme family protein, partial [Desulfatiglandales bacterium]|nr:class I adenylate-forming enzyme family protein [Desulfatiglandales bacterium]